MVSISFLLGLVLVSGIVGYSIKAYIISLYCYLSKKEQSSSNAAPKTTPPWCQTWCQTGVRLDNFTAGISSHVSFTRLGLDLILP